jgi:hypothetical protein
VGKLHEQLRAQVMGVDVSYHFHFPSKEIAPLVLGKEGIHTVDSIPVGGSSLAVHQMDSLEHPGRSKEADYHTVGNTEGTALDNRRVELVHPLVTKESTKAAFVLRIHRSS